MKPRQPVLTVFALTTCATLLCHGAKSAGERIAELEIIIKENGANNLGSHSVIARYWELADLHKKTGDDEKWYGVLIKGLRIDPFEYDRQIEAAVYEYKKGEKRLAIARLNGVAGDESMPFSAQRRLARETLRGIPKAVAAAANQPPVDFPTLADGVLPTAHVMPFPGVDETITAQVARRLADVFHCDTPITPMGEAESVKNARDVRKQAVESVVEQIQMNSDPAELVLFMERRKMALKDLETNEGKEKFAQAVLSETKNGAKEWERVNALRPQLHSEALFDQALAKFGRQNAVTVPSILGVLIITAEDVFMGGKNNFVYAAASNHKKAGVISCARFAFDKPSPVKLARRYETQVISTFAFAIGLDRCSIPRCANSQSYSIAQLERKSQSLCEFCEKDLVKIYKEKFEKEEFLYKK